MVGRAMSSKCLSLAFVLFFGWIGLPRYAASRSDDGTARSSYPKCLAIASTWGTPGFGIAPARIISSQRLDTPVALATSAIDSPDAFSWSRTNSRIGDGAFTAIDQSFAQYRRNTLRDASPTFAPMSKPIVQIVAANVHAAFECSKFSSENELARAAGVAPNTLRNIMSPGKRAPNARGEASPRLDVLAKVAKALGYDTWQLLVDGFKPADPLFDRPLTVREVEVYKQWEDAYKRLPPLSSPDSAPE
jgi:transcriptional regulator with XRE-family HTH domain